MCLFQVIPEGFGSPGLRVAAFEALFQAANASLRCFSSVQEVRCKKQAIYIEHVNLSVSFYK